MKKEKKSGSFVDIGKLLQQQFNKPYQWYKVEFYLRADETGRISITHPNAIDDLLVTEYKGK